MKQIKSEDGHLYKIVGNRLITENSEDGCILYSTRTDIAKVLKNKLGDHKLANAWKHAKHCDQRSMCPQPYVLYFRGDGSIEVGCQTFSKATVAAIRRWANRKQVKKDAKTKKSSK